MKFRRVLISVLILCFAVLGFSACGGGSGGTGPTSTSNTVRVVLPSKDQGMYESLIETFENQTDFEVEPIYNLDTTTKQDTMIGARDYPDIIIGGDLYLEKYAKIMLDISFLKEDQEYDFADFYENLSSSLAKDGKQYFVPRSFNTSLLYYNTDLVKGEDVPTDEWTYEDFERVAKKLTNLTADPNSRYFGCTSDNYYWSEWAIHVRQEGGAILGDDGMLALNTPEAKRGIEKFVKKSFGTDENGNLVQATSGSLKYKVLDNRYSPEYNTDASFSGFVSGRYAFQYGGHTNNISEYKAAGLNFDVALLPLVKQADGSYSRNGGELAIDGVGIYKNTKAYDASVAFIKYLTGKDCVREMGTYGVVPVRESIANEWLAVPEEERTGPKNLEAIFESVQYNEPLPRISYFVDVMMNSVQPIFNDLMSNSITIDDMITKVVTQGNAYINLKY